MILGEGLRHNDRTPQGVTPLKEFDPFLVTRALQGWRPHNTATDVRIIEATDAKGEVWRVCVNPIRQEVILSPFLSDWRDNQVRIINVEGFTFDQTNPQNPSVAFSGIILGEQTDGGLGECILSPTEIRIMIKGQWDKKISLGALTNNLISFGKVCSKSNFLYDFQCLWLL